MSEVMRSPQSSIARNLVVEKLAQFLLLTVGRGKKEVAKVRETFV